jgi:hypothetical protein
MRKVSEFGKDVKARRAKAEEVLALCVNILETATSNKLE